MRNAVGMLVRPRWLVLVCAALATVAVATVPLRSADLSHGYQPPAYAIQGAKIVLGTGTTIEKGTVVVRHGLIEAVGEAEKVAVPYDAELIDGKGLVVYPGFIDLFTTLGQPAGVNRSGTGPPRPVSASDDVLARTPLDNRNGLTPEFEVASVLALAEPVADERRRLGFTDLLAAPAGAIATGQSALVGLSGLPRREAIVRAPVALHINLRHAVRARPAGAGRRPPRGATVEAAGEHRRGGPAVSAGLDGGRRPPAAGDARRRVPAHDPGRVRREEGPAAGVRPRPRDALRGHGPGRSRSGGRRTPATRSTARSTWPRSSAPAP